MITGGSFEVGFPDIIQQMWAAFLMERECALGSRFGCATPAEAVQSHRIFAAALASQRQGETVSPSWERDERSSGGTMHMTGVIDSPMREEYCWKSGNEIEHASSRRFRLPKAWGSRVTFASGRSFCRLATDASLRVNKGDMLLAGLCQFADHIVSHRRCRNADLRSGLRRELH